MKIGCQASMTIKADRERGVLFIEKGHFDHNHDLAKPEGNYLCLHTTISKLSKTYANERFSIQRLKKGSVHK